MFPPFDLERVALVALLASQVVLPSAAVDPSGSGQTVRTRRSRVPRRLPSDDQAQQVSQIFRDRATQQMRHSQGYWKQVLDVEAQTHSFLRQAWKAHLQQYPTHARDESAHYHDGAWMGPRQVAAVRAKGAQVERHVESMVKCASGAFKLLPLADPRCMVKPPPPDNGANVVVKLARRVKRAVGIGQVKPKKPATLAKNWHLKLASGHLYAIHQIYGQEVVPRFQAAQRDERRRQAIARQEHRVLNANVDSFPTTMKKHILTLQKVQAKRLEAESRRDKHNEDVARALERTGTHAQAAYSHQREAGVGECRAAAEVLHALNSGCFRFEPPNRRRRRQPPRVRQVAPVSRFHLKWAQRAYPREEEAGSTSSSGESGSESSSESGSESD